MHPRTAIIEYLQYSLYLLKNEDTLFIWILSFFCSFSKQIGQESKS